jgi:5'-nucleotidase (lipoprotein e(P4) family)
MKKIFYPLLACSCLSIFSFGAIAFNEKSNISQQQLNQQSLLSINWMQQSGEYRALAYQAFNMAKLAFDTAQTKNIANPTVIVDLDETILDNSPYQASLIGTDQEFNSKTWNQWILAEQTKAIPGAVEFVNYVNANGGKVFFISNRNESSTNNSTHNDLEIATMNNMLKLAFTGVSEETLLLKGEFSKLIEKKEDTSKQWRREAIINGLVDGSKHNIVVLLGDNLNDFEEIETNNNQSRKEFVDQTISQQGLFVVTNQGFKPAYISLPNPMYGDWENGLYDSQQFGKKSIKDLTPEEKTIQRKQFLIKWQK